jgi:heterodisulfide reductase subunit A
MSKKDVISLIIDDIPVTAEEGTTILEAARAVNIEIPTLCYHKALSPYGACGLCIVEIIKNSKAIIRPSCIYKVEDGLIVKTNTERVIKNRRLMVELLLARCPDAQPVKRIAERMGIREPRVEKKNKDCLLCGLCVRMCRERMGRGAIGFAHRGAQREIKPAFDAQSNVCQTCGACFFICPTQAVKLEEITKNEPKPILAEFDQGLRERPAIYIPFPQAVPNVAIIDKERCVHVRTGECKICQEFCEADAIHFDQKEEVTGLNVGSIILAPGFDEYDATNKSEYGYGRYKNVVTSIEFERILSASGPYQGHVVRPSDKNEPRRIAFIQCVGSRDPQSGRSYCSSVCCTYAIKEALIAKEHTQSGLVTKIFCMDIRTFGKGFEVYYERAKNEYGVIFIRAGVSKIDEVASTKNLIVHYESEDGEIAEEEFDMVVLSVGLVPKDGLVPLVKRLRVNLNQYGFCKTSEFMPVETLQDGVYVCGTFAGPKDIPETVTQASAAASRAMGFLAPVRNTLVTKKEYPPERDVLTQEPRIGVFVCYCGINIGGYVDVPQVVEYAKMLPGVVYAESNLYTCSQDTQKKIVDMIKEHTLNRVVVASCTPRTHEPLFRETVMEAGLNPYLFEMANIRDQCSWIHMHKQEEATEKAKDILEMAIAKARLLVPLKRIEIDVIQKALVIGGGIAGMISSLSLARQGFRVYLVEKENELGGHLRHMYYTIEGRHVQNFLRRTITDIKNNTLITLYTGAHIESVSGFVGNFETQILTNDGTTASVKHGVTIVATGAKEYTPTEYFYGTDTRVITQRELEELLEKVRNNKDNKNLQSNISNLKSIVMIQCIGSRDDEHVYCSRICCAQAIKNALQLLEICPQLNIYVLYRDMRTYGFKEDFYRKARESGVIFMRYTIDEKPVLVNENGKLTITVWEPILKEHIELSPDLVVLSSGIEAMKENKNLAEMLKVPLNDEGFFLEAHVKLRPVDFATEGIFVAGMAHSPKCIDEAISQAEAAAARAAAIITHNKYYAEAAISHVNEDLCAGCGLCSSLCPYEAIEMVTEDTKRRSKINEALCKGCGTCVAACPSGAMEQYGFTKQQIMAMVEAGVK